ncbi:MAG: ferredoxin--nitrite reductase [Aphanocapsa feldmannii 277cV]|uniref:Ferredoxin--nitrite reductase n=2 Tax=Aphanocapsa feldmannii TaxID=192050 RepID=A0A524RMA6_9CHRO|nr:MAG: ferredoxin--nitrite reductase [Aphanocapsa feldmannii 288cV]TGG91583.1 MAG: ferredoxin--nitrite reductase [Aphanocapsa feldmannii 277cV]TGH23365.1 MAG: ferredoxin--nitrite reductase [Aphanocapsa feldmannii 277cI]
MQQGDRVRVCESVIVYTHPEHRGEPYDLKGQDGEVFAILSDWKGRPISPTLPVVVKFARGRFHFRAEELESL